MMTICKVSGGGFDVKNVLMKFDLIKDEVKNGLVGKASHACKFSHRLLFSSHQKTFIVFLSV